MKEKESYDIIVIGGGHNGLTCAAYLAKAGLRVVVLERRELVGGGVMTEELTLPGFKHNTHSAMHEVLFMGPVYYDLELKKYGSMYKFGPGLGHVFEDGTSLILYRDIDRTCKTIEKFSKRDAKAYKEMVSLFIDYTELLATAYFFNPPLYPSQTMAQFEGTYDGREFIRMMQTSPYYLVDQIFENENVKTWILLHVTQAGITQDSYGCGIYFPVLFPILHKSGIGTSVGGSKSLADAMVRVIEDNEGVVKSSTEVKEIIVKDGVAMGVKISDGTEFLAKRAVACNIGPTLIFGNGRMIEEEHLDGAFIKQIKHWRAGEVALFTLHLALEEPVMYKASARDPEIQRCYTIGMCESTKTLQRQFNKIKIGEIPKGDEIGFLAVMPTAIDSTQAPPGKHTAFIWQYAPNTKIIKGGAEKWDEVKEEYEEECLEAWGRYTHNLKKPEVILAKYSDTPLDIVRRNPSMIFGDFNGGAIDQDQMGIFRPFHGYLPNKTPIENLYLCGPTAHPSGGCHGGAGYIAANVMAEELKIKKWWPTPAYFGGPPEEEE